jgi:hypothetical protein
MPVYKLTCQYICFEASAATEFNEIFSGRQPREDVKVSRRFGANSFPKLSYLALCTQRGVGQLVISFGSTKPPAHPEDGAELLPETLGNSS